MAGAQTSQAELQAWSSGDKTRCCGVAEGRAAHGQLTTEGGRRDESGRLQLTTGEEVCTKQSGMKKCRERPSAMLGEGIKPGKFSHIVVTAHGRREPGRGCKGPKVESGWRGVKIAQIITIFRYFINNSSNL